MRSLPGCSLSLRLPCGASTTQNCRSVTSCSFTHTSVWVRTFACTTWVHISTSCGSCAGVMDDLVSDATCSDQDLAARNANSIAQSQNLTCQSILQSLSQLWPSLPALLLSGAVQRLCQQQQQRASVLAGWVKALLACAQVTQTQKHSPVVARAGKRKSITHHAQDPAPVERSSYTPTAAQLKACIQGCLVALPASSGQIKAAAQKVLLQLLDQLQHDHALEYASYGKSAQTLLTLCKPQAEDEQLLTHESAAQAESSCNDLRAAQQKQKLLMQHLQATANGHDRSVA